MEKERKSMLNQLVKLVDKDGGEYIASSNKFIDEDVEYLSTQGIKATVVKLVRKGLLGDYEVEYLGTKFERVVA